MAEVFYLVRSRQDGRYLTARPEALAEGQPGYLLLFQEHFEALTYLNTHAPGVSDRFSVESLPSSQVGAVLKRWGFGGVGIVRDPLIPNVQFMVP